MRGVPAYIVCPEGTPEVKLAAVREYGGQVKKKKKRGSSAPAKPPPPGALSHSGCTHARAQFARMGPRAQIQTRATLARARSQARRPTTPPSQSPWSGGWHGRTWQVTICAPNLKAREEACARIQAETGADFVPPYVRGHRAICNIRQAMRLRLRLLTPYSRHHVPGNHATRSTQHAAGHATA